MPLVTFSAGTKIKSADMNANLQGLANGTNDTDANSLIMTRRIANISFVYSGLTIATSVNLSTNIAAGVCVANGKYLVTLLTAKTFTASKDTYVYLLDDGTFSYQEVVNNAASPTAPLNSDSTKAMLIAIVVTSATAVTLVNQGRLDDTGPTVGSTILTVCDSIGNLIYPTSASTKLLGARRSVTTVSTSSGGDTEAAALAIPIIIPGGGTRKVRVTLIPRAWILDNAGNYLQVKMWNGAVGSGSIFRGGYFGAGTAGEHYNAAFVGYADITASATIRFSIRSTGVGQVVYLQGGTLGEWIEAVVELI